jgi:hypothetical protein
MSDKAIVNLCIIQGSTFSKVLRWGQSTKTYKAITAITRAAPAVVTATGHGIPNGWPVLINNVEGMEEINSTTHRKATVLTVDTIELNEVNAAGFTAYEDGGVVEYNTPVDLTGFTARLQMRSSLNDETVQMELTTENGGISISTANYTITLNISAADTADIDWTTAVYSLEMISGSVVTQIAEGSVTVSKEVTR